MPHGVVTDRSIPLADSNVPGLSENFVGRQVQMQQAQPRQTPGSPWEVLAMNPLQYFPQYDHFANPLLSLLPHDQDSMIYSSSTQRA